METRRITTEIYISEIEGRQMPDEDTILKTILHYLSKLRVYNATVVDMVQITHIDGVEIQEE